MPKGVTLVQGQVVVLKLDGSLVYIEAVEAMYVAAVALPEQPADRADERVFKPGCVGAKKISPFAEGDVVLVSNLSERNKKFIGEYEGLRKQHGPTYVDRTPEEQAAFEAANAPKPPKADKAAKKAEREAAKAAKKAVKGPRFLQRCVQCGEQQGHPKHPSDHEFVAPPEPVVEPEKCIACGKPEEGHGEEHKFIGESMLKKTRAPKADKPEKEAKTPRVAAPGKPRKSLPDVNQKFKWVQNDAALTVLVAANGKFSPSNSGGAMIETIKAAGDAGICVTELIVKHPRPIERLQLALEQLRGSGLLEAV
jgi:hypothetical protein